MAEGRRKAVFAHFPPAGADRGRVENFGREVENADQFVTIADDRGEPYLSTGGFPRTDGFTGGGGDLARRFLAFESRRCGHRGPAGAAARHRGADLRQATSPNSRSASVAQETGPRLSSLWHSGNRRGGDRLRPARPERFVFAGWSLGSAPKEARPAHPAAFRRIEKYTRSSYRGTAHPRGFGPSRCTLPQLPPTASFTARVSAQPRYWAQQRGDEDRREFRGYNNYIARITCGTWTDGCPAGSTRKPRPGFTLK